MRIAIIDAVPHEALILVNILKNLSEELRIFFDISAFADGEEFSGIFKENDFRVIFVDGITTARYIRQHDKHCIIIFLTESPEYMHDAFLCHAFEYIQKPFTTERIVNVMTDALEILPHEAKYMELTSNRQTVRAFLTEIVSVVTDAHYLDITLTNGKKLHCRMKMSEFHEKTGKDKRFIPVNRGITVNAEYIIKFEDNCCIIKNGSRFPVCIRERAIVEQMVKDYNFEKLRNAHR